MSKKGFEFNYSAKEQAEIKSIREKYTPQHNTEVSEIEKLRKIDNTVSKKAVIYALSVGIISTLILGFGMSLIMTDLSNDLGINNSFFIGVVVGIIGLCGVVLAFPTYRFILKKERKKIAPLIIELTDKLLK